MFCFLHVSCRFFPIVSETASLQFRRQWKGIFCPEVERVEATRAQQVAASHARIPGIPWIPWITGLTGLTGVTEALAQLGTANSLGTRAGLSAVDSEVLLLTTCFLVAEWTAVRHWRVEGFRLPWISHPRFRDRSQQRSKALSFEDEDDSLSRVESKEVTESSCVQFLFK